MANLPNIFGNLNNANVTNSNNNLNNNAFNNVTNTTLPQILPQQQITLQQQQHYANIMQNIGRLQQIQQTNTHYNQIPTPQQNTKTPNDDQPAGFFRRSAIYKSLTQKNINDNPDIDLFRMIIDKYGSSGADLITVNIQFYSHNNGNLDPIKLAKPIQQLTSPPTPNSDDINILNHANKIPASMVEVVKKGNLEGKKQNNIDKKELIGVADSGITKQQFEETYEYMIMNKTVGARNLTDTFPFMDNQIAYNVQDILKNNNIITISSGSRRSPSIAGKFDSKTKRWKKIKKTNEMDNDIYELYCKYTKKYNDMMDEKGNNENSNNKQEIDTVEKEDEIDGDKSMTSTNRKRPLTNSNTNISSSPPAKKSKTDS
eukprot:479349_1